MLATTQNAPGMRIQKTPCQIYEKKSKLISPPVIDKKIDDAIQVLEQRGWCHSCSHSIQKLIDIGLKIEYGSGICFLSDVNVIKASLFIQKKPPEKAIPTHFLKKYSWCERSGANLEWVIQPKTRVMTEEEFNKLDKKNFFDQRYGIIDVRAPNMCYFNNKPMALDW